MLFSFFRQQTGGAYLALSTDGLHWQELNQHKPVIIPEIGDERLMRDPSLHHGSDGKYRLVWTTDWKGKSIGYAESTDLLHGRIKRRYLSAKGSTALTIAGRLKYFIMTIAANI